MTVHGEYLDDVVDVAYLDVFPQATAQLHPDEIDRRSALIRRARFELNQRRDLKPSKPMRRIVEILEEAVELLEGER